PLDLASWEGHNYIVRLLFDHGADANPTDDDDSTSLHIAFPQGHDAIVELLLDHGADANPVDSEG
ncbi:ankyrin repeat-containing domain protein, partial [Russula vinacea]